MFNEDVSENNQTYNTWFFARDVNGFIRQKHVSWQIFLNKTIDKSK